MRIYDFFYNNKFWLFRHALFWSFIYIDELLSFIGIVEPVPLDQFMVGFFLDAVMVYFNLYYLIPKFFNEKKISSYILFTGLSLIINIILVVGIFYHVDEYEELELVYDLIFALAFTSGLLGLAIAAKISKINFTKQKELRELEYVKHEAEVNNLKKQINPHFLFNVLNNMYVQSKESPTEVPETILKLSDLMRYQTYDASKNEVALSKEIEFINQYIDFEKMRREHLQVSIDSHGSMNNISIPPLLFLSFIENACKHSSGTTSNKDWIHIKWSKENDKLIFDCSNSIGSRSGFINDDEYSGFGLDNVKKRLELLFPNKHTLNIKEENDTFSVHLELLDI